MSAVAEALPNAAPRWVRPVLIHAIAAVALVIYPLIVPDFWSFQIGGQSLFLGVVALSLMFLGGYGGMVSLAQMTIAGVASYLIAIMGGNSLNFGPAWPWWAAVPIAIAGGTLAATLIGVISVRTSGIYTIMITIAIAMAFFYLAQQNYTLFNGHSGFASILPPHVFGLDWRAPIPFYFLSLAVAVLSYALVLYLSRSTFGIALQGIRDNARRMRALGFNVTAHRVAAYAIAGFIASFGGVLLVWFNSRVSPGTVDTGPIFDILVIAVLGGMRHPIGPFLGAVIFVLLENFAIDFIDRERFNTLIGACFLAIVLFSPDGVLGLWGRFVALINRAGAANRMLQRPIGNKDRTQPAAAGRPIPGRR
jgi:branched-chain amino acid transport system permease protein